MPSKASNDPPCKTLCMPDYLTSPVPIYAAAWNALLRLFSLNHSCFAKSSFKTHLKGHTPFMSKVSQGPLLCTPITPGNKLQFSTHHTVLRSPCLVFSLLSVVTHHEDAKPASLNISNSRSWKYCLIGEHNTPKIQLKFQHCHLITFNKRPGDNRDVITEIEFAFQVCTYLYMAPQTRMCRHTHTSKTQG